MRRSWVQIPPSAPVKSRPAGFDLQAVFVSCRPLAAIPCFGKSSKF